MRCGRETPEWYSGFYRLTLGSRNSHRHSGMFSPCARGPARRAVRVPDVWGGMPGRSPFQVPWVIMIATNLAGSAMSRVFENRSVAGRELAARLAPDRLQNAIVLALPRGGVPVGYEVAHALKIPLDVLVVRKVGAPFQPELAIGAVGQGATVLDADTIAAIGVPNDFIQSAAARERVEVERRTELFRPGRPPIDLTGKTVVLVDDGLATGATAEAAVDVARQLGAVRVIVAVPVASYEAVKRLRARADEVISLVTPPFFRAVGYWYEDFTPTEDDEVLRLLNR